jgi:hypothetical protein
LEKLKELAHWERKKKKDVINEGLGNCLNGGKIKPVRLRKEKMR